MLLAVEIVSPSSKRIDHRHERDDYADAGIPNYCRLLTADFGYQDNQVATGEFVTDVPFAVSVSLDRLV